MGWDPPGAGGYLVTLMHCDLSSTILFSFSSILGIRAVEPPEEGEISEDVEPGIKVFSSSAWAQWGPHQAQVGPEEDRDHLHHPQDDAREADGHESPWVLSLGVQSGLEEDRDHFHHS